MKLSDVIEKEIRGQWGDELEENETGIPVIKTNNMTYEGKLDLSSVAFRSIKKEKAEKSYLENGDLLIEKSGGTKTHCVGYINFFDSTNNKYVPNNFILSLRPNRKVVNPKYLFFQLRYKYEIGLIDDLHNQTTGIQNLYVEKYLKQQVKIPLLEEQDSVVFVLNKIESEISKERGSIYDLNWLIKSRFIEMFEVGKFTKVSIKNLVDVKKLSSKKTYSKDETIKYIDISSIDNSVNKITTFTEYAFKNAPSRAQQCLLENDILVSTVRPNLKNIAMFNIKENGYVGSSGFCVLRAKTCNPWYLLYCVLQDDFTSKMVDSTNGASYPAITDNDVLNYKVINAPLELQNEFADFVKNVDKLKFIK